MQQHGVHLEGCSVLELEHTLNKSLTTFPHRTTFSSKNNSADMADKNQQIMDLIGRIQEAQQETQNMLIRHIDSQDLRDFTDSIVPRQDS